MSRNNVEHCMSVISFCLQRQVLPINLIAQILREGGWGLKETNAF